MGQASFSTNEEKLEKALALMDAALQLLDEADSSADVGAHLDLAICRLKDIVPESVVESEKATTASRGRKPS